MLIKKIRLKNFKNFKDAELELGDMNVLVGANASGKSNFLQALKFLKDIQEHGLENAISLQGGMEYLRNVNCGEEEAVEIEIDFQLAFNEKFIAHIDIGNVFRGERFQRVFNLTNVYCKYFLSLKSEIQEFFYIKNNLVFDDKNSNFLSKNEVKFLEQDKNSNFELDYKLERNNVSRELIEEWYGGEKTFEWANTNKIF